MALKQIGLVCLGWLLCITAQNLQEEKYEITENRAPENECVAEEKYKINQNRAPWNKCHDENEYEPIFTDLECRQAAEALAIRYNTFSRPITHWPPGCFWYSGPKDPQDVYLPTLNKQTSEWHTDLKGSENHRMICQKKKEKYKINQNCAPWNKCHDEDEYEPIFTDLKCREAAEFLGLRYNTFRASISHWPPGCFFFSGPRHPQNVYLPNLNKPTSEWHNNLKGSQNHRMICQKKEEEKIIYTYKVNQNSAPWNKCHENGYEPIFEDLECREAAESLAIRFNSYSASRTHWPPGCFFFTGPRSPHDVYLPTLNKPTSEWQKVLKGSENHRLICKKRKEKYVINQNSAPWNTCHNENEYEPIFTNLECREAAESLALRFNTYTASRTHWPPGCFFFSGPRNPQEVYLPTLNKPTSEWYKDLKGSENHRMICKMKEQAVHGGAVDLLDHLKPTHQSITSNHGI